MGINRQDFDEIYHDPTDTSWKQNKGEYKSGRETENLEDLFSNFENFLEKKFKNKKDHLQEIAEALGKVESLSDINSGNRYQKSLSEVLGNSPKTGEVLALLSESQGEYLRKHKGFKGINFYDPEYSRYLQNIIEAVEHSAR